MSVLKKFTSLILSCSMALTFCSCQTLDHLGMNNNDFTKYSKKIVTKVDNNFIKWCDSSHFFVNGHEIIFGRTTAQQLYDTGAYCVFYDYADDCITEIYYSLEDDVRSAFCEIYPDEASAEKHFGGIGVGIRFSSTSLVKFGIVSAVYVSAVDAEVWGDNFALDFPLTITPAELLENSGEPRDMDTYPNSCQIRYYQGINEQYFEFDKHDKLTNVFLHEQREASHLYY